jgi:hypothetical protein
MHRLAIRFALRWLVLVVEFCCRESAGVEEGQQPDSPSGSVQLLSDIEISCSASDRPSSHDGTHEQSVRRPDVLFIVIEDMAAILGSYGHPVVRTPNIDRLAGHGVLFERAYAQAPVCNPSRASVSTGLRPETTGVDHNDIDWRGRIPKGHLTLPEFFQRQGYETY